MFEEEEALKNRPEAWSRLTHRCHGPWAIMTLYEVILDKFAQYEGAVTALQRSLEMIPRKQLSIGTSAESGSVIHSCVVE